MRTLVHLSDLHFGELDPDLLEPLRETILRLDPHLVVVSGDLTQRAKSAQFIAAKRFLDLLPRPQVVVPGNHDVPLYNVYMRFFKPLDRFTRHITADLEPWYADEEIAVTGVNTARSLVFKGGRINEEQIDRVAAKFCNLAEHVTKVVVTHHPFDVPVNHEESQIVGRAAKAMTSFARCGADLLLSGHLHTSHSESTAERYRLAGFAALVVQAGTATSTRERGESNSFNFLRISSSDIHVDRFEWDPQCGNYILGGTEAYEHSDTGWKSPKSAKVTTMTPPHA